MPYALGPRAQAVYGLLAGQIRSGELAPGTRLPPYTELAVTFAVAPLTMRQVLARLEADQLLIRERGRGTFVRATAPADVLIVAADPTQRTSLLHRVGRAGGRPTLAGTAAEGLAALAREHALALLLVELHLPRASDGLTFVRAARRRRPALLIAVLDPTGRQRTRLEHTVGPPLVYLAASETTQLEQILHRRPVGTTDQDVPSAQLLKQLLERYLALQLAGERASARQLLLQDGLAAGIAVANLYLDVLQSAQHRIGELWQHNSITVAREHLATAITDSVMADLTAAAPRRPRTGGRVLVACVEGELHEIGARMVADLLELDGFDVRFLGANVPTTSLLSMVQEEQPRLVILSVTMPQHLRQLEHAVARLHQVRDTHLLIFVGGQAVTQVSDLARRLAVDLIARDARETLEGARRLLVTAGPSALVE
jgi:MerR family transcriptional regulator, light-induced transcriptional regulator